MGEQAPKNVQERDLNRRPHVDLFSDSLLNVLDQLTGVKLIFGKRNGQPFSKST